MATIEDLNFESIVDMSKDEAIEQLRQIRLSRRTPVKKVSTKKPSTKSKKPAIPTLTPELAKELLNMFEEE